MDRTLGVGRAHVISMCRLRHVVAALSHLYFPDGNALGTWSGTEREGDWLHYDSGGDHWMVAWTPTRIVGLVFDHESPRSRWSVPERDRDPLEHLDGITEPWSTLAREAAAHIEDLVTAGFWGDEDGVQLSDPGFVHGLDHFEGVRLGPQAAVLGDTLRQSWAELHSLRPEHGALAIRLAQVGGTLTDDDADLLLEVPDGVRQLDLEAVRAAGAQLAEAGVRWRIPTRRIRSLNAELQARERARIDAVVPAEARALFEAVRGCDAARVRMLAVRPWIDARTVQDQWEYTPAGDTPLIQACKAGARDSGLVLVAAGADVDLVNAHGQSGLLWAARFGDPELLRACIAATADAGQSDHAGHTPLHHVAARGDTELAELLVARGADSHARDRLRTTPADWADRSGHAELADILRARRS